MTKSMLWTSVFLLGGAIAMAGCGGGDDDDTDAGGGLGTGGIGVGTGGVGTGTGGATGTGGMTGGTGGMTSTAMPVPCGSATCMAPSFGGMTLGTACCADATAGTCGTVAMDGMTCTPPAMPDPRCPEVMFPVVGARPSCCADNGMCGLDGSMFGMGCVDYATVKATLMGVIQVPDPVRCDAAGDDGGAPTGNDAGN